MGLLEDVKEKHDLLFQKIGISKPWVFYLVLFLCLCFCFTVVCPYMYSKLILEEKYRPLHSLKAFVTLQKPNKLSAYDKDRQEWLEKTEHFVTKVCPKMDIRQFNAAGDGVYDFYIHPYVWARLNNEQKDVIFQKCILYVYLKTKPTNKLTPKKYTKVRSLTDGEILAQYVHYILVFK